MGIMIKEISHSSPCSVLLSAVPEHHEGLCLPRAGKKGGVMQGILRPTHRRHYTFLLVSLPVVNYPQVHYAGGSQVLFNTVQTRGRERGISSLLQLHDCDCYSVCSLHVFASSSGHFLYSFFSVSPLCCPSAALVWGADAIGRKVQESLSESLQTSYFCPPPTCSHMLLQSRAASLSACLFCLCSGLSLFC
ncbi:hypothetical protein INR49_008493 [Caranx melampygus]|nr:hypothetical protein INR49_008493 [Caranx melampygus]